MRPLVRKFIPVSLSKGSRPRKESKSWGGSSNSYSNFKQGTWISLEKKNSRRPEMDTIDQAENGNFLPVGASGLGSNMGAWYNNDSGIGDSENVPLKPQAVHVQSEVMVDRSKA